MAAFKALRDVSNSFEEDLRRVSEELFTARISEPFEDVIANKLSDLQLYTSKLRFLQAKTLSAASQTPAETDKQATLDDYTNAVKWKIVEQQVVKSVTQAHAVKALLTAPDGTLQTEMLDRKQKITEQLAKFEDKEVQLRHLDTLLQERQQHLDAARREWDEQLGRLKRAREEASEMCEGNDITPLSTKLHRIESMVSSMRGLLARLATSRGGGYDWLADPQRRLRALQLARQ